METVQVIHGHDNLFHNNKPGKGEGDMVEIFCEMLSRDFLTSSKAAANSLLSCTPDVIAQWFSEFEQFLDIHDLKDRPFLIWNADESGFPLCPRSGKVIKQYTVLQ